MRESVYDRQFKIAAVKMVLREALFSKRSEQEFP